MAVHSLIRSVSPTIGGYIFQYYGFMSFGVLGVVCNGALYAYMKIVPPPETPSTKVENDQ